MHMRTSTFPGILTIGVLTLAAAIAVTPAGASTKGNFSLTLNVSGPVDLDIQSGSGNIHVHRGPSGAVQINAVIEARGSDAQAHIQAIESNPPIEQQGNTIKVGHLKDSVHFRDISISYEVTVPEQTSIVSRAGSGDEFIESITGPARVSAGSGNLRLSEIAQEIHADAGSGDITLTSCGGALHLQAGSGSVTATGAAHGATVSSGSGDVRVTQIGPGDDDLESGSGSIQLDGADGAVSASTGSGDVTIQGKPARPWRIRSGSGNIQSVFPKGAGFELSASSISGKIDSKLTISVSGDLSSRQLHGTINGGGALVTMSTASGDIRIE
jgi:DUF4097 and DUF4098 domain-containing protein YvlB